MEEKFLTHENGAPVTDNTKSLTAGKHGRILLEDAWLIEKLAHFDREVIPERRMHAKGSGAFGHFTVTHDVTEYTCAKLFSEIGRQLGLGRKQYACLLYPRPTPVPRLEPCREA